MPLITVKTPLGPAVAHHLEKDVIAIGRSSACDLVVQDSAVSRRHAEIRRVDGHWVLVDLGSRHGTRLRGARVGDPVRLAPGDEIHLGRAVLLFADEKSYDKSTGEIATPSSAESRAPALVGSSAAILAVIDRVERVAPTDATVLVTGETGTGKELISRLLHLSSRRSAAPFVVVNCPALPGSLLESELFGVEAGVATGVTARPGRLETAAGGTVFLDEIAEMDVAAQSKLLRFLQDRTIERVGGRRPVRLDVRVVCATNRDLQEAMACGDVRRDLYHRLSTVRIHLPPLRERREDLPVLIEHFLSTARGRRVTTSPEALALLSAHDFPGNVRELEQVLAGARLLAKDGVIRAGDLPQEIRDHDPEGRGGAQPAADTLYRRIVVGGESFWDVVQAPYLRREIPRDAVQRLVARAHAEGGGSYKGVARLFGIEGAHRKLIDFLRHHDLGVRKG